MALSPAEAAMSPPCGEISAPSRDSAPTGLGKKRTLSPGGLTHSTPTTPVPSAHVQPAPANSAFPKPFIIPSPSGGGLLSSALSSAFAGGGGLSSALRSQSAMPRIAIGEVDTSGAVPSPLSSATPLSCTPTDAMPMPRRKYHKPEEDNAAGSAGSQDDEIDSAAMPQSVRDPGFIAPHLLLSMSMPSNNGGFGHGAFRPGSVMEGRGRKLCGIDASRVRDDILRQTGFLEPGDSVLSSGSVLGGP